MKINPKYGEKIITIPASGVLENLPEATREELAVLIFALANQSCTKEEICRGCALGEENVADALAKWKKLGVFTYTGFKGKKTNADNKKADKSDSFSTDSNSAEHKSGKSPKNGKIVILSSDLPSYTTTQISELLEKNKETKNLIDACQQTLGKILKIHEIEVILKLYDFLNLDSDYILLLCAHCAAEGKTTLRYIEKTAVSLFDSGITEYAALEEYFKHADAARGMEGKIRSLFGMGERAFTKKERSFLIKWASWDYTYDIIEKAYEAMVDSIHNISFDYLNRILENWHNAGLASEAEIDRAIAEFKASKSKGKDGDSKGSFSTEDFFEAALDRSYNS